MSAPAAAASMGPPGLPSEVSSSPASIALSAMASPLNWTRSTFRPCFSAKPPLAGMKMKPASLFAGSRPCFQVLGSWAAADAAIATSQATAKNFVRAYVILRMSFLLHGGALDRCIHGDIAASLVCKIRAAAEIIAVGRHAGMLLPPLGTEAEIIAVPGRFRLERRQPQALPDRARILHEFAFGQGDGRESSLEGRVDEDRSALAVVTRRARAVSGILVRHDVEVMLRLATGGHGREHRVGIVGIYVLVDRDDPLAGEAVQRRGAVEGAPDLAFGRVARELDRDHRIEAGERLRHARAPGGPNARRGGRE